MTLSTSSSLSVKDRSKLLPVDQRHLRQALSALPAEHFEEAAASLGFLNPASSWRAQHRRHAASSDQRAKTLLSWAKGPKGPGVKTVEQAIAQVTAKYATEYDTGAKAVLIFAVTHSSHGITNPTINAFVAYLREKTEDRSIEIDGFEKSPLKLTLKGAENRLERLQDLFELGKLKYAPLPPIETVHLLDKNMLDSRKALLVKALRLRNQALAPYRQHLRADARSRANALARVRHLTLARVLIRDLTRRPSHALTLMLHSDASRADRALARLSARDINSEIDISRTIALIRALNSALSRTRNHKIARAIRSARQVAGLYTHTRFSNFSFGINRAIAFVLFSTVSHALSLSLQRTRDLASVTSNLNLAKADLRGASLINLNLIEVNLTRADLTGADLTGADLTGAKVTGTLFGDNLGMTAEQQQKLQRNGAIFQNSTGLVDLYDESLNDRLYRL